MMNGECVVNSFRHDFVVPPPSMMEVLFIYDVISAEKAFKQAQPAQNVLEFSQATIAIRFISYSFL